MLELAEHVRCPLYTCQGGYVTCGLSALLMKGGARDDRSYQVGSAGDSVEHEGRSLVHDSRSGDEPGSQDPADVAHPQAHHDRVQARVVDLGEGDHPVGARDGKGLI